MECPNCKKTITYVLLEYTIGRAGNIDKDKNVTLPEHDDIPQPHLSYVTCPECDEEIDQEEFNEIEEMTI